MSNYGERNLFIRKYTLVLVSIIFLNLLRLFFISNTMLIDDEAYYAIYSHHLDLGYIDHGPVIAYLIRLFTILFGGFIAALETPQ